jgi:hypothetical protein
VVWGVPKGSYASNPDGPSRIIEYRLMVQVSFSFYHGTFLHEELQLASLIIFLQCMEEGLVGLMWPAFCRITDVSNFS